ncbi:bactofilin family protein [Desulfovibrio gilichinskyi]|nr:polymer-forming cytoskeletal protein [Desulfovibrio gilichinskyi]
MARDEINAFLGSGTDYQGKLNFQGAVRIDGNFSGEVESEGTLVVGKDARVEGVLRIGQLVLSGKVTGEVYARDKAVLHKTANLQGNLVTPVLVVEEGAVLEGRVTMSSAGVEAVETVAEEIS